MLRCFSSVVRYETFQVTEPVLTPPHSLVDTFELSAVRSGAPTEGEGRGRTCDLRLPQRGSLVENIFFGDVSPKSAPYLYIRCIGRCAVTYRSRSGMFGQRSATPGTKARGEATPARGSGQRRSFCHAETSDRGGTHQTTQSTAAGCTATERNPQPGRESGSGGGGPGLTERASSPLLRRKSLHADISDACVCVTPLLVNTAGWTEGLGGQLLDAVGRLVRAAAVIRVVDENKGDNTREALESMREKGRSSEPETADAYASTSSANGKITGSEVSQSTTTMRGKTVAGLLVDPGVTEKEDSGCGHGADRGGDNGGLRREDASVCLPQESLLLTQGKTREDYLRSRSFDGVCGTTVAKGEEAGRGTERESRDQPETRAILGGAKSPEPRQSTGAVVCKPRSFSREDQAEGAAASGTKQARVEVERRGNEEDGEVDLHASGEGSGGQDDGVPKAVTVFGRDHTAGGQSPHGLRSRLGGYRGGWGSEEEGDPGTNRTGGGKGILVVQCPSRHSFTRHCSCGVSGGEEEAQRAATLRGSSVGPGPPDLHPVTWSSESSLDEDGEELVRTASHAGEDGIDYQVESTLYCSEKEQRELQSDAADSSSPSSSPASPRPGHQQMLQTSSASSALLQLFPFSGLLVSSLWRPSGADTIKQRQFSFAFAARLHDGCSRLFPSFFSRHVLLHSSSSFTNSSGPLFTPGSPSSSYLLRPSPDLSELTPCTYRHRRVPGRLRNASADTAAPSNSCGVLSPRTSGTAAFESAACAATGGRRVGCRSCRRRSVAVIGENPADSIGNTVLSNGKSSQPPHSVSRGSSADSKKNAEGDVSRAARKLGKERRCERRLFLYRLMQSAQERVGAAETSQT